MIQRHIGYYHLISCLSLSKTNSRAKKEEWREAENCLTGSIGVDGRRGLRFSTAPCAVCFPVRLNSICDLPLTHPYIRRHVGLFLVTFKSYLLGRNLNTSYLSSTPPWRLVARPPPTHTEYRGSELDYF